MKASQLLTVSISASVVIALSSLVSAQACSLSDSARKDPKSTELSQRVTTEPSIPAVALQAGQFNTLLAALKATGLDAALTGEGPFTVLAPTDEAFAKLPAGTLESLLKPENKDQLSAILKYHVISGKVPASDVVTKNTVETLQGSNLGINVEDETVSIGNATVLSTDIMAGNGVIHVIDSVLLPKN